MATNDRLRTVEGVIISHKDYGEADRFVTFFSREGGKIRALAKGVRRMGSRKAAYLEPFMRSKIVLARGKSFWIITQADAIRQHLSIRESLEKTGLAAYVMELADRFTIEDEPSARIFDLIAATLERIDQAEDTFVPLRFFELNLLDRSGFRPDLTDCVGCGQPIIARDQFFSTSKGGVLCPDCGILHRGRPVSLEALRYLRHIQRSAYAQLEGVNISSTIREEINAVISKYLSAILERRLNAPEFIRQVAHSSSSRPAVK